MKANVGIVEAEIVVENCEKRIKLHSIVLSCIVIKVAF